MEVGGLWIPAGNMMRRNQVPVWIKGVFFVRVGDDGLLLVLGGGLGSDARQAEWGGGGLTQGHPLHVVDGCGCIDGLLLEKHCRKMVNS